MIKWMAGSLAYWTNEFAQRGRYHYGYSAVLHTPEFLQSFSTANTPLPKPFLHAPNTPVGPFQPQGKVWVRVSTTEKERGIEDIIHAPFWEIPD